MRFLPRLSVWVRTMCLATAILCGPAPIRRRAVEFATFEWIGWSDPLLTELIVELLRLAGRGMEPPAASFPQSYKVRPLPFQIGVLVQKLRHRHDRVANVSASRLVALIRLPKSEDLHRLADALQQMTADIVERIDDQACNRLREKDRATERAA